MKTQKYLNTAVAPAIKRQIRIAAAREDCSMSEFVRRAIEARIEQSPAANIDGKNKTTTEILLNVK